MVWDRIGLEYSMAILGGFGALLFLCVVFFLFLGVIRLVGWKTWDWNWNCISFPNASSLFWW
jgi:hypothetical protein